MGSNYTPINCDLYDYLEQAATLKKLVQLTVTEDDGNTKVIPGIIKTFSAQNGVEHLILENGTRIRLDKISHLDGSIFANNRC